MIFFITNVHLEEQSLAVAYEYVLCILNGLRTPIRGGVTFTAQIQPKLQANQIG